MHSESKVLRLLGSNPRESEIALMLKQIDVNRDGTVDFDEFAFAWHQREVDNLEAEIDVELKFAFDMLDSDQNGFLSVKELVDKLTKVAEKLTVQEANEFLRHMDQDFDGHISFEEFKRMPCWQVPDANDNELAEFES
uniref:EF-hand domain-containing protein n=1 Tax=Coccolithus braarudii TaxID=221442 RepID=A0A7S0PWB7_9EUKA|mmetsp:Transcript_10540/g.22921  ORF Transcript_10540/g.22921 Transcript_10540/m.22921 type:complete len:138 (+) Transcript_10540:33-446(+)|eukprot:CAMPEP_0183353454 /NCGR_PEP_ID=MMETSP0164_2-20130417/33262_1 /TAXON_ID=221442 /ORGANISM="Coccolithus pelagicus ssp braarudi, Strain PLY182g" /LENGTH=137 /DNA_ID=CAMNT_0025526125 /DNA_START=27 /DNA_END=440 /DNA_ORIENTATION=+